MSAEGLNSKKSVDELKTEIRELENLVKEIKESIKDRENAIVELIAEFQMGDRVIKTDYKIETDHKGKESVYIITERRAGYAASSVRYWGKLIKKDGSLGALETDLSYAQLRKA